MYRFVDDIISAARAAGVVGSDRSPAETLKAIDGILIAKGCVYPPRGLTQLLCDGLTPRVPSSAELSDLLTQPHNIRRRPFISSNPRGPFYYLDCDTASFLYLAVADALSLPLYLVEVPQHNFVRWYISDAQYLNWETMDGILRDDRYYEVSYSIPDDLITNGVFLTRMSRDETLGYVSFCVGGTLEQNKKWLLARDHYATAVKLNPRSPTGWNNHAWILVSARDASFRDGITAIASAKKSVELHRTANALDTLACAYAETGNFAMAIEVEEEAYRLSPSEGLRKTLEGFRNGKTWAEQNPEPALIAMNANR